MCVWEEREKRMQGYPATLNPHPLNDKMTFYIFVYSTTKLKVTSSFLKKSVQVVNALAICECSCGLYFHDIKDLNNSA